MKECDKEKSCDEHQLL